MPLDLLVAWLLVLSTFLAYGAALNTYALVCRGFDPVASPRLDFALSLLSFGTWAAFVMFRNAHIRRSRATALRPVAPRACLRSRRRVRVLR
jgi:hypothetical protein